MFTYRGISVDTFARIDADCAITCDVVGGEAQFEFGDSTHAVSLVMDDAALGRLGEIIAGARARLADPGAAQGVGPA